eukprot:scaffold2380_cov102-Isochrysis_galbana.AAC.5
MREDAPHYIAPQGGHLFLAGFYIPGIGNKTSSLGRRLATADARRHVAGGPAQSAGKTGQHAGSHIVSSGAI